MQAFQTAEELEAEDSWFCSKCKRHVQANKKLDLWAVPEVLVVHLKRFFFTRARRDKLDVRVDFPLENWDLSDVLPRHQVTSNFVKHKRGAWRGGFVKCSKNESMLWWGVGSCCTVRYAKMGPAG